MSLWSQQIKDGGEEMRPRTNKCGCYGCSNKYGRRGASNVLFPQKRNIKCTSSPSSLQRKITDKFLTENDFEMKQGSLNSTSIQLSDENINMYIVVCT